MEEILRDVKRDNKSVLCPLCQVPLKVGLDDAPEVHYCIKCHGLWGDTVEEGHFSTIKIQILKLEELKLFYQLYDSVGVETPLRYVSCPICQEKMSRKIFGNHPGGIAIDKCYTHGTWYASGQVDRIQEYIMLGNIKDKDLYWGSDEVKKLHRKILLELKEMMKRDYSFYNRIRFFGFLGF